MAPLRVTLKQFTTEKESKTFVPHLVVCCWLCWKAPQFTAFSIPLLANPCFYLELTFELMFHFSDVCFRGNAAGFRQKFPGFSGIPRLPNMSKFWLITLNLSSHPQFRPQQTSYFYHSINIRLYIDRLPESTCFFKCKILI